MLNRWSTSVGCLGQILSGDETTEGVTLSFIPAQREKGLNRNVSRKVRTWIVVSCRSALPPGIAGEEIVGDAVCAQSYFSRSAVIDIRKQGLLRNYGELGPTHFHREDQGGS